MMSNLLWLAVCLLLAIGVWYIVSWANISIDDRTFDNRPINFKESEAVALVSGSATMADLYLQGEETTLWRLTSSDIEIIANLLHLPPGSHTVALVVKLPDNLASPLRRVLQPAEITVDLESRETRSVAVAINIGKPPPIGFRQADPEAEIDTVLVSGAASQVAQVQAARGLLDLSTSRSPIAVDLPLQAIDAAGKRVADVSLSPQSVLVTVPISRRDDVKQVTVNPKILFETLPAGFSVKGISTSSMWI